VQDLVEAWAALISRHSRDPDAIGTGRALLAAWSEPHRTYHSVGHLRAILAGVEDLAALGGGFTAQSAGRTVRPRRLRSFCPSQ
jgi:predicted metal-dependent HD superfamily phosphohydrolase